MKHISRCVNHRLQTICQQAIALKELNRKISDYLPDLLREHFFVGSYVGGCMVLMTDDSVWASQLRYSLPEIRNQLRSEGGIYNLSSIKITVVPESLPKKPRLKTTQCLSKKARENIMSESEACQYAPLKEALRQLGDGNK